MLDFAYKMTTLTQVTCINIEQSLISILCCLFFTITKKPIDFRTTSTNFFFLSHLSLGKGRSTHFWSSNWNKICVKYSFSSGQEISVLVHGCFNGELFCLKLQVFHQQIHQSYEVLTFQRPHECLSTQSQLIDADILL